MNDEHLLHGSAGRHVHAHKNRYQRGFGGAQTRCLSEVVYRTMINDSVSALPRWLDSARFR